MTPSYIDVMHRTQIFVGGKWIRSAGAAVIDVIDPATESIIGSVPNGTAEDVERAVRAAREAFGAWSQTSPDERAEWAQGIADPVTARVDDFAELIAREIGVPLAQSRAIQVKLGTGDFAVMPQAISEITWEEKIDNSIVLREPIG